MQWPLVQSEFKGLLSSLTDDDLLSDSVTLEELKHAKLGDILSGEGSSVATLEVAGKLEKARMYANRLSADAKSSNQGCAFVNGKWFELNDVS